MKQTFNSTCSYCGVGCNVIVSRDGRGRLSLAGDESSPVNQGRLCSKGRYLHRVVEDTSDRLLYPQMRWSRAHPLERVSWDTAIARAAAVFGSIIRRYGPESVGFYCSGQMLTEEYYVANKLVKGFLGSNNIDTNSRLCMSSAVSAYKLALGDDAVPVCYEDIDLADCFLISGANPAWCHPILYQRIEQRKAAHPDARVIVVDPRRTASCDLADLHLQIQPGTDVTLHHAIGRRLVEWGLINRTFIEAHTEGFEALSERLFETTVEEAARVCDVPIGQIDQAADWIGQARGFLTLWAMGLNQSEVGVEKNLSLINLNLLTGQIGKPGAGPLSLTGQPNAMGGREVGGLATLLAAHHNLNNPEHRRKVAAFWGVEHISENPGLTATEMFDALADGRMKAIWIICTNPAVSLPNLRNAEKALANARFVVVQDISNRSDTAAHADLLLPAAGWLEKQGTMTNSERRISYLTKVVEPPGEARPDSRILCHFAEAMGFGEAFNYADESEIFAEHAALTRGTLIDIGGVSYERLKREGGIRWPCPDEQHPGTPRLFADHCFPTPSKRARLHAVPARAPGNPTDDARPFILTTGRLRDQWHTMTRTGKVERLRSHADAPFVEIHPEDAAALGLRDGETAELDSAGGTAQVRARITDTLKRGVVFLPMHWGRVAKREHGRANNLTSGIVDPISREPDFKYTPVAIRRVAPNARRIVVVGAGAASLAFVQALRERQTPDSITVLGREPQPYYNRVLLPDYISGRLAWTDLLTADEESLGIAFRTGAEVARIDRERRRVHLNNGHVCEYDQLVLATGSRANWPAEIPRGMEGVFSLRERADADRIRECVAPGANAIIVGGGLLGLELAAALMESGARCTILHRSDRLMRQQLDVEASGILLEEIRSLGIRVILGDTVLRCEGGERITAVRTQSGLSLPCDALFSAAGVEANAALARDAGLHCRRGIVVDDQLRTSDSDIYAIGEVAEHAGHLCGTTPAAQEQARVAAAHVSGDVWAACRPTLEYNVLKVPGIQLCAAGLTDAAACDGAEEIVLCDRARGYYKKCLVKNDVLVGAILMGDASEFAEFRQWIERKTELEELRDTLLRPGSGAREICEGRLVCSCNNVGEGNLEGWIEKGCDDLESLCASSRAGTGCGSCRPEVRRLLESMTLVAAGAP